MGKMCLVKLSNSACHTNMEAGACTSSTEAFIVNLMQLIATLIGPVVWRVLAMTDAQIARPRVSSFLLFAM